LECQTMTPECHNKLSISIIPIDTLG
jgi:hypothetical protein